MLLFLLCTVLSLFYGGSETIRFSDLNSSNFIFSQIRFPKTITAIIAGATLAASGLVLQVMFRNPLAGPYVLGISSGASLSVALCLLAGSTLINAPGYFLGKGVIVLAAITGSVLVTILILIVSKKVSSNVVLLLIGIMFSQICGAIQAALEYFSDPNNLKSFVIWGMGSLANTTSGDLKLFLPLSVLALLALTFFIKPLNAMLLGENYAQNVGVNYKGARFWLILISSVLTGLTTAFCGPLAFVGIAVPILSRMLFNTSRQQIHLISCLLIGSIVLLISDALCHSGFENVSLPINMVTTFIGAPLVIYLMFKNKSW
ncbi:MAG: iron ABC transporter permease [Bacteroidia bacterium]|nr:iron ABC transporter permease [Bacteroidia bacterium]